MTATHYSELGLLTRTTGYYFLLNSGSIQPHFPNSQGGKVLHLFFYKHMQKYKLRKGEKMTMHTFNILEALEASACA